MNTSLQLTIAKLELKQLEVIDKLSHINSNDYLIRCITEPHTNKILDINGDWEKLTGYKEQLCIGSDWFDFIEEDKIDEIRYDINKLFILTGEFDSYKCDMITKNGSIAVNWKSKYFPEINAIVSIGKVDKSRFDLMD